MKLGKCLVSVGTTLTYRRAPVHRHLRTVMVSVSSFFEIFVKNEGWWNREDGWWLKVMSFSHRINHYFVSNSSFILLVLIITFPQASAQSACVRQKRRTRISRITRIFFIPHIEHRGFWFVSFAIRVQKLINEKLMGN